MKLKNKRVLWLPPFTLLIVLLLMLTAFGQITGLNGDMRTIKPDPFGLGFEDNCLDCHKYGLPDIAYYCHELLPTESYNSRLYLKLHFAWIASTLNLPPELYIPPPTAPAESDVYVNIFGLSLLPTTVTIPVGATVTWVNLDIEVRTIASNPASDFSPFDSIDLAPGAHFSYTFTQPGVFNYFCKFSFSEFAQARSQYNMLGMIIVGDQSTDSGPADDMDLGSIPAGHE